MATVLDLAAVDTAITTVPDFTLVLETATGRRFEHVHGVSSATTSYESASTSKLVSAVVIMDLVDQGVLTLDTKAHELLPSWTETSVTLRHLLSFTSGFWDEPLCLNLPNANFASCVQSIFTTNVGSAVPAGSQFYYASTHLQVAGMMAVTASGLGSWGAVFSAFKARTGLFPTGTYDLPSATNPRLAGGMHWTAEEYLGLLRALYHGTVLTPASRAALFANQRGAASVEYSPIWAAEQEDWAYGLGNWLECSTATTPNSYACGAGERNSSPGAYGAYPFLDVSNGYFGVLARQGPLGTFQEGLRIFRTVEGLATQWALGTCTP